MKTLTGGDFKFKNVKDQLVAYFHKGNFSGDVTRENKENTPKTQTIAEVLNKLQATPPRNNPQQGGNNNNNNNKGGNEESKIKPRRNKKGKCTHMLNGTCNFFHPHWEIAKAKKAAGKNNNNKAATHKASESPEDP